MALFLYHRCIAIFYVRFESYVLIVSCIFYLASDTRAVDIPIELKVVKHEPHACFRFDAFFCMFRRSRLSF